MNVRYNCTHVQNIGVNVSVIYAFLENLSKYIYDIIQGPIFGTV